MKYLDLNSRGGPSGPGMGASVPSLKFVDFGIAGTEEGNARIDIVPRDLEVLRGVAKQKFVFGGDARPGAPHARYQSGAFQTVLDGIEPLRTLGMVAPHQVPPAVRVRHQ